MKTILKHSKSKIALSVLLSLGLTACGSDDDDDTAPIVAPVNVAPTAIALSNTTIKENASGIVVGELSATDSDDDEGFTYTVSNDAFEVDGSSLKLKADASFDYEVEAEQSVVVDVTVTDSAGNPYTESFTITVEDELDYYSFPSAFVDDDSVAYSGQVARQMLINELTNFINSELGDVTAFTNNNTFDAADITASVMAKLNSYYEPDTDLYAEISAAELTTSTVVEKLQTTLGDISSSKKNLTDKIAGNDAKSQYKDWNTVFAGWGAEGSITPEQLIKHFFEQLAANAAKVSNGESLVNVLGNNYSSIYVTADGVDLKQMVQKVLLMTVAFSQGADDYLDLDLVDPNSAGKGVYATNARDGDKNYTKLEHQIDEGFGYFGAARGYLNYSDDEIKAAKTGIDHNGDGKLDLQSEFNFGQSVNAAKRDIGSANVYDFSATAMNHFLQARKLASDLAVNSPAEPTISERQAIFAHTKAAVLAWENSIASSAVHYINDTIGELDKLDTDDFNYANTAKYWSEMKAFAIGLQFNRHTPLAHERFVEMHVLMGDKPVLVGADDVAAYKADLLKARTILQDAYGYDQALVEAW